MEAVLGGFVKCGSCLGGFAVWKLLGRLCEVWKLFGWLCSVEAVRVTLKCGSRVE